MGRSDTEKSINEKVMGRLGGSRQLCLTLDFGSGHDLTVHESESCVGLCADSAKPA